MNSKQRVMAAAHQQPTDHIPCDFHCCGVVLERLYAYFGVSDYIDLLHCLHSDVVDIRGIVDPDWVAPFPQKWTRPDGSTQDYLGFCKKVQNTVFGPVEEHCDYVLQNCEDLDEIRQFRFPKVEWFDFSTMSKRLEPYQEFAVMASGASIYQHPTLVRGLDTLLCDLLTDPETAEYILDAYTDFYLDYFKAMFEACPGQIDILRIADDLGMQDRTLISLDVFLTYFKPRIKKLCDLAHSFHILVLFHSCGSVFPFIDHLIDAGVDILDPLQPNARDMDPQNLWDHFAGRVCFHGSIDTQYVLPQGSTEEVRAQVRKHIGILNQNHTGFIISPAHSLQPDVTVENIAALYDEVHRIAMQSSD